MKTTVEVTAEEIHHLRELARKVAALNEKCSEIGAGMLAQICYDARAAIRAREHDEHMRLLG